MIPSLAPRFTPSSFNPSFVPAPSPKTAWQRSVAEADLPFPTKGILLIVATEWMDADGGSCYPTEQQIMERAGISRPCLTRHMRIAEERGYIRRWRWGHGNRNRRYNYQATLPGAPIDGEMGNDVSYPTGEMGNDVSLHKALPSSNPVQKPERAAEPDPAPPEPTAVPPSGALSVPATQPEPSPAPKAPVVSIPVKTALPEDWQLPEEWREWAQQQRPDLADLDAVAGNFRDYHLSKGTRSASWIAEWRRWINRERAPKAPKSRIQAPQTPPRYAPFPDPKAPVPAAVQAALEQGEQRRIEMLRKAGIDPKTGLKIGVDPIGPSLAGLPPLPDGSPPPSGQRESPEQYRERIEQHRQFQLERLARLIAEREGTGLPPHDQPKVRKP